MVQNSRTCQLSDSTGRYPSIGLDSMVRRGVFLGLVWTAATGFAVAQTIDVGDTLRDLAAPLCANGEGDFNLKAYDGDENGGDYSVTWITFLASWCIPCREEAPITESIYQAYKDDGLKVLGVGFEWGYPYSCEEWSETFGISYPLVDDDDSLKIVQMFDLVYLPYHVFIDHNMVIRYILSGWDEKVVTDTIQALLAEMNTAAVDEDPSRYPAGVPRRPELRGIHPNPFNSSTSIFYVLPFSSTITLDIFDLSGRHVITLERAVTRGPGLHQVQWRPVAQGSGIYLVRLEASDAVVTRKVLLVK
ncbi:MAG: redoxin domain-containing protein [Fidelibacterota bacterium]